VPVLFYLSLNPSPLGEGLNVFVVFLHPLLSWEKGARGMRH